MKRLLILLLVLINLSALGQTYTAERIVATRGFYLKDRWVDSIGVDTVMQGEIRSLPSSDAVYRLVHGRLTNLSIPYSAITGKPDLVLQATLDDSTSVLRDSINALRADIASGGGGASLSTTDNNLTISGSALSTKKTTLSLIDGATISWDMSQGYNAEVVLAGNRTLSITNAQNGQYGLIIVKQDATGGRTLLLPGNSEVINGGAGNVTLSTTGNAIDILTFFYDGATFYWTIGKNYN